MGICHGKATSYAIKYAFLYFYGKYKILLYSNEEQKLPFYIIACYSDEKQRNK